VILYDLRFLVPKKPPLLLYLLINVVFISSFTKFFNPSFKKKKDI
jgi:hypothetical protein